MAIYKEVDGLKYIMEQRWEKGMADEFPNIRKNLVMEFQSLESHLNKYHPNVNLGAAIAGDGVLTDHGVEHVQMVMDKAFHILKGKEELRDRYKIPLNGYEIYLLLVAIHFHDLGNITGRDQHEQKIVDIMNDMGTKLPLDIAEQEIISEIARAHGGYVFNNRDDKDTLRLLLRETTCNNIRVRPIIIAAILRFADELADDFSRFIDIEIPDENKIFHEYSKTLEPLGFEGKTVIFKYRIPFEKTKNTLIKNGECIFLYDEILCRLSKCLRELDYCRKYSDSFIDITTLNVSIKVNHPTNSIKSYEKDTFCLELYGYPNEKTFCLNDFVAQEDPLTNVVSNIKRIKYLSGEELMSAILEKERVNHVQ